MSQAYNSAPCFCVIGSMTQAMKAQRILSSAAIHCKVEKADSSITRRGCAYAIYYPCEQDANVRLILRQSGIRIKGGG